jgi:hypothetical protein
MKKTILLLYLTIMLVGCTAPMIQKTYNINLTQFGVNDVSSDILKDYEVTPTLKNSLK